MGASGGTHNPKRLEWIREPQVRAKGRPLPAASQKGNGPSLDLENASVTAVGPHGPLRSAAPSASTPLRSAVAKRTRLHEVSVIAVSRWPRLDVRISITCMQPA